HKDVRTDADDNVRYILTAAGRTECYTLSLHDALPISIQDFITSALLGMFVNGLTLVGMVGVMLSVNWRFTLIALSVAPARRTARSEEHTSELQSRSDLVCRLLLEKKKRKVRVDSLPPG